MRASTMTTVGYHSRMTGIGLLNERPLHASLKEWYARPGDRVEAIVDGFVIDIVKPDLLVEIQTGNFAAIKPKLASLLGAHKVRLVYPIALEKWIVKLASDGCSVAARRKSPRRGRVVDLFWEMVSFPRLLASPNLSLEVVMTREEELRRYEGKRRWRRRGWAIVGRRLLEVVGRRLFRQPADWRALLPEAMEEPFTTRDLAETLGIRRRLAQRMAYCLREAGVVEARGKQGRANLYEVADA
jgi:hypothetical protein